VDQGDAMRIVKGTCCLEAATYDPNPHSWFDGTRRARARRGRRGHRPGVDAAHLVVARELSGAT
jgi:hypothetical protein